MFDDFFIVSYCVYFRYVVLERTKNRARNFPDQFMYFHFLNAHTFIIHFWNKIWEAPICKLRKKTLFMPNVSSSFCIQIQMANVKMWNETCKKLRISKDSKKKAHKKKRGPSEKRKIFLCSFHRFIYDLQVCEKKKLNPQKKKEPASHGISC